MQGRPGCDQFTTCRYLSLLIGTYRYSSSPIGTCRYCHYPSALIATCHYLPVHIATYPYAGARGEVFYHVQSSHTAA